MEEMEANDNNDYSLSYAVACDFHLAACRAGALFAATDPDAFKGALETAPWAASVSMWGKERGDRLDAFLSLISFGLTRLIPNKASRSAKVQELEAQCHLLRDIFGNPFRQITVDPNCLAKIGSTALELAQAIYNERRFENMRFLVDALTDAGCAKKDILIHCASEGPHVRGCWALDLILGKH